MVNSKDGVIDELDILNYLKSLTLVGLLPVPHPIVIREYQRNDATSSWITGYMWSVIFIRGQKLPMFDGASIKLFTVRADEEGE